MADPLHGVTLDQILTQLVDAYGFPELATRIPIKCFEQDASIPSALKFLRRTPWARTKVEGLYLFHLREQKRRRARGNGGDLRGAVAAIVAATKSVTTVVEEIHGAFGAFPVVTDLVYATVRGVTGVVGVGVDAAVAALAPLLGEGVAGPEREAVLAALNGVIGDHLEATGNSLAIPMAIRPPLDGLHDGGTLLLLVHGSCMNDLQWMRGGHDHGRALARDLGFTPAYLHCNTGRHVSDNGQDVATLLEIESAPFRDVVVVAHSMGGLIARSAIRTAETSGLAWRSKLRALVMLGTPHQGAPLERGGNIFQSLLGKTPWSAPLQTLGRLRSAGVTDMRHGNVVAEDWQDRDRFAHGPDPRMPTPLPDGVRCYAIAGSNSAVGTAATKLKGDNLVPVASALGRHRNAAFTLQFTDTKVVHATSHLGLLSSADVYAALHEWLRG